MQEERNAEIAMKRKAGRTLRSLAHEYGLSAESIRRIEVIEEQREQKGKESFGLSERARNATYNVIGYWKGGSADESRIARQVAAMGRTAFAEKPNVGKKTLLELDAWLAAQGLTWSLRTEGQISP